MKIKLLESEAEYPFRSWFRRLRFSENCIVRVGSRSGTIDRSQCSIPSPREYKCRPNDTIYCCNHNHPQSQAFFVFLSRFPFAELSHSKCFPSSKSNMKKNGLTPGKWERSLKLLVIFRLCNLTHVMTAQLPLLRPPTHVSSYLCYQESLHDLSYSTGKRLTACATFSS